MIGKRRLLIGVLTGLCLAGSGWGQSLPSAPQDASAPLSAGDQLHEALAMLQQGQYAQAQHAARELLSAEDPDPQAWLVLASSYQQRRLYEAAAQAYDSYLEATRGDALAPFVRSQIRLCREGNLPRLQYDSLPSESLSPEQLEELSAVDDRVHTETSEQFVVRARNSKVAKLMVRQAEKAMQRVCDQVLSGQAFHKSVDVYVWKDRKDYLANACDAPDWSGGSFSVETKRGRVVSRRIDLTQNDEQGRFNTTTLDRILPHELCHLVLDDLFAESQCPLMLNEGLAMLAEYQLDNDRVLLAGTAISGKERVSLQELLAAEWSDLDNPALFYASALSFTEFIYSRLNQQQFARFLHHVRNGQTVPVALQRSLAMPAREDFSRRLSDAWETYAIAQSHYLRALDAQLYSANKRLD
jgi:tetratricopeptide (TPR) repeat protein